jgi:hypothetical protein
MLLGEDLESGRLWVPSMTWPSGSFCFPLPPHPIAAEQSRILLHLALAEWNMGGLADDALIITAELVTNAMKIGEVFHLTLSCRDGTVMIEVSDGRLFLGRRARGTQRPSAHATISGNSSFQNAPPCDPTRSVMTTSAPASRSAVAQRVAFSRKNGSSVPATRYARGSESGITAGGR